MHYFLLMDKTEIKEVLSRLFFSFCRCTGHQRMVFMVLLTPDNIIFQLQFIKKNTGLKDKYLPVVQTVSQTSNFSIRCKGKIKLVIMERSPSTLMVSLGLLIGKCSSQGTHHQKIPKTHHSPAEH